VICLMQRIERIIQIQWRNYTMLRPCSARGKLTVKGPVFLHWEKKCRLPLKTPFCAKSLFCSSEGIEVKSALFITFLPLVLHCDRRVGRMTTVQRKHWSTEANFVCGPTKCNTEQISNAPTVRRIFVSILTGPLTNTFNDNDNNKTFRLSLTIRCTFLQH